MAKDQTVAPKERINIVYKPATDMDEEKELPLKLMVMGDFTGREDDTAIEDRDRIEINKGNFNEVLNKQEIEMEFGVADRLDPNASEDSQLAVKLKVDSIKSFHPEEIAKQIPDMEALLQVRNALVALKGPLGSTKAFSKKLKEVLKDDASRERLKNELGFGGAAEAAPSASDPGESAPSEPTNTDED